MKNAVAFHKKEGKAKALAVFSDSNGLFTYRDLYISVMSLEGTVLAHGRNKARIGKRYLDMTAAGFKEQMKTVLAQGSGWTEYKWENPANHKVEQKIAYMEVVDDVLISCGAYKPES